MDKFLITERSYNRNTGSIMVKTSSHAHVSLSDVSTSRTLDRSAFRRYGQVWRMLGNVKLDDAKIMRSSPIFRGGGSAFRNIT